MHAQKAGLAQFLPQRIGLGALGHHLLEIFAAVFADQFADAFAQRAVMIGGIHEGRKEHRFTGHLGYFLS